MEQLQKELSEGADVSTSLLCLWCWLHSAFTVLAAAWGSPASCPAHSGTESPVVQQLRQLRFLHLDHAPCSLLPLSWVPLPAGPRGHSAGGQKMPPVNPVGSRHRHLERSAACTSLCTPRNQACRLSGQAKLSTSTNYDTPSIRGTGRNPITAPGTLSLTSILQPLCSL